MENAIPLNEAAAKKQLLTEYCRVSGKPADSMAEMICKISAKRALSGEPWKWIKDDSSPNWSMQLHWGNSELHQSHLTPTSLSTMLKPECESTHEATGRCSVGGLLLIGLRK